MFFCEWQGINRLTPWTSPGWAGFTVAQPHHFWSSPNSTPPWFEAAVGREALDRLWRNAPDRQPGDERLAWCDRPPELAHAAARRRFPRCTCYEDRSGPTCDEPVQSFCLNQCSGRGECVRSYCQCHRGWTGADCSTPIVDAARRAAALPFRPGHAPDLLPLARAHGGAASPRGLRPSIYVYELPVRYNGWTLETRMHPQDCTYRRYVGAQNETRWENYAFGLEMALHETLLASPHRTLNPEAAVRTA